MRAAPLASTVFGTGSVCPVFRIAGDGVRLAQGRLGRLPPPLSRPPCPLP